VLRQGDIGSFQKKIQGKKSGEREKAKALFSPTRKETAGPKPGVGYGHGEGGTARIQSAKGDGPMVRENHGNGFKLFVLYRHCLGREKGGQAKYANRCVLTRKKGVQSRPEQKCRRLGMFTRATTMREHAILLPRAKGEIVAGEHAKQPRRERSPRKWRRGPVGAEGIPLLPFKRAVDAGL